MPGFPDRFMPFMDEPPGASLSGALIRSPYGPFIRKMRGITKTFGLAGLVGYVVYLEGPAMRRYLRMEMM